MLRHVDLFAGTGGFSVALQSTGKIRTIYANDLEPNAKKLYDANHDTKLVLQNLLEISVSDIPAMDILTAGFPCQPFSIAGLQQGFNDPRSNVFWKLLEIIHHHQPRAFILENVKNLVSHDQGKTFQTIISSLETEGYTVQYKVLNTSTTTGIPHNRERIYIVGFRLPVKEDIFSFANTPVKVNNFTTYLQPEVPAKYYYDERFVCWKLVQQEVVHHISTNTVYQIRRQYVRQNKSGVCPTLTANMGSGGHNVPLIKDDTGIRKLTPRECFNLQGFPQDYHLPAEMADSVLYKLAGNAITVVVAKVVVEQVLRYMKQKIVIKM